MNPSVRSSTPAVLVFASAAGLLIAASDLASPFGDDSAQFTVFLWLVSSGVLGFARPVGAWRWAVSLGPWLPLVYLVARLVGRPHAIKPAGYTTILILLPVSIIVCLLGAYGGVLARRFLASAFSSTRGGVH